MRYNDDGADVVGAPLPSYQYQYRRRVDDDNNMYRADVNRSAVSLRFVQDSIDCGHHLRATGKPDGRICC